MEPINPNNITPAANARRRLIMFVAIGFAVLIVIAATAVIIGSSIKQPSGQTTTEATPSDTPEPTPTPQDTAKATSQPDFIGLDGLLDIGVADDQITDLKYAFSKFAAANNKLVDTIAITKVVAAVHDPNSASTIFTATFTADLDGAGYTAKYEYSDLTAGRLFLSQSGKQIFDSGVIDVYNGIGVN
jgi:hypothetical protein